MGKGIRTTKEQALGRRGRKMKNELFSVPQHNFSLD